MAKAKKEPSVHNRNIYTRASYLHQAATYLASLPSQVQENGTNSSSGATNQQGRGEPCSQTMKATRNLSRQVTSDMKWVSLKAQIRQSRAVKQTICKFCDTVQVEGQTSRSTIENPSNGGRKTWADVLVIRCLTCENVKRYPVSAPKQTRRDLRVKKEPETQTAENAERTPG